MPVCNLPDHSQICDSYEKLSVPSGGLRKELLRITMIVLLSASYLTDIIVLLMMSHNGIQYSQL